MQHDDSSPPEDPYTSPDVELVEAQSVGPDARRIGIPRFLEFLFNTRGYLTSYVLRMTVVSFLPTILLAILLERLGVISEQNSPEFEGPPIVVFIGIVLLSPVVETLMLAGGLWLMARVVQKWIVLAAMSSLLWAILHSLAAPMWGVLIAWPFFIFSSAYLAWREHSWGHAYAAACAIHALHNTIPGIMMFFT